MWHQRGEEIEEILLDICDQYTIQGDLFSQAVLNDTEVPTEAEIRRMDRPTASEIAEKRQAQIDAAIGKAQEALHALREELEAVGADGAASDVAIMIEAVEVMEGHLDAVTSGAALNAFTLLDGERAL